MGSEILNLQFHTSHHEVVLQIQSYGIVPKLIFQFGWRTLKYVSDKVLILLVFLAIHLFLLHLYILDSMRISAMLLYFFHFCIYSIDHHLGKGEWGIQKHRIESKVQMRNYHHSWLYQHELYLNIYLRIHPKWASISCNDHTMGRRTLWTMHHLIVLMFGYRELECRSYLLLRLSIVLNGKHDHFIILQQQMLLE